MGVCYVLQFYKASFGFSSMGWDTMLCEVRNG